MRLGEGIPLLAMDNMLVWNVRGLNNTSKQAKVKVMLASHNIKLFSLLETRVKAPNLGKVYLNVCRVFIVIMPITKMVEL